MLGDLELDIFAQFFLTRFFSRDRRALLISSGIREQMNTECACWINLSIVGYSRVDSFGNAYFSD